MLSDRPRWGRGLMGSSYSPSKGSPPPGIPSPVVLPCHTDTLWWPSIGLVLLPSRPNHLLIQCVSYAAALPSCLLGLGLTRSRVLSAGNGGRYEMRPVVCQGQARCCVAAGIISRDALRSGPPPQPTWTGPARCRPVLVAGRTPANAAQWWTCAPGPSARRA